MDGNQRREEILKRLQSTTGTITATEFAKQFGVTRQIIVSDIALLRANDNKIISERRGYSLEKESDVGIKDIIICKHSAKKILDELYVVVDNGGKVINVIVEHPIYGQITGDLGISSRYDADEFVKSIENSNASQLCDLTGGVHYHTVVCPDEDTLLRIKTGLENLGILQGYCDSNIR